MPEAQMPTLPVFVWALGLEVSSKSVTKAVIMIVPAIAFGGAALDPKAHR